MAVDDVADLAAMTWHQKLMEGDVASSARVLTWHGLRHDVVAEMSGLNDVETDVAMLTWQI